MKKQKKIFGLRYLEEIKDNRSGSGSKDLIKCNRATPSAIDISVPLGTDSGGGPQLWCYDTLSH